MPLSSSPRRALLLQFAGVLAVLAVLPVSGPAAAEPAAVPPGFTLNQLIRKLEQHFPEVQAGQGSLLSDDGLPSDLLPAANRTAILETLGPPEAVHRFAFSYDPGDEKGSRQSRHWAGVMIRNALPGWRHGKTWVHRAMIQAEKAAGVPEISETAEDYWITVSNPRGRVVVEVSPLATLDTDVDSLGVSLEKVLAGLGSAFPRRDQGMGTLFNGPGSISDRFFSDNAHATLETLGPSDDLAGLRYLYELRDDHPEATRDNRGYALRLVQNVFPDWAEAGDWLQAAIDKAKQEADKTADYAIIDRGPIRLQVRYFIGATAAIDIMVFPKNTQI